MVGKSPLRGAKQHGHSAQPMLCGLCGVDRRREGVGHRGNQTLDGVAPD